MALETAAVFSQTPEQRAEPARRRAMSRGFLPDARRERQWAAHRSRSLAARQRRGAAAPWARNDCPRRLPVVEPRPHPLLVQRVEQQPAARTASAWRRAPAPQRLRPDSLAALLGDRAQRAERESGLRSAVPRLPARRD